MGPWTLRFRAMANRSPDLNPLDLYLWGHLKQTSLEFLSAFDSPVWKHKDNTLDIFCNLLSKQ
jgi:hypothetical protein